MHIQLQQAYMGYISIGHRMLELDELVKISTICLTNEYTLNSCFS